MEIGKASEHEVGVMRTRARPWDYGALDARADGAQNTPHPMRAFRFLRGAAALLAAFFHFEKNPARAEDALRLDLGAGQALDLVRIEPGIFQQGSPSDEAGRGADETQRTVTISRPFLMGKYPVTRRQFARFVSETGFRTEAESGPSGGFGWDGTKLAQRKEFTWRNPGFAQTEEHPVTIVSSKDAEAFLRWLARKGGRTFSLPSEAQWEYAARAGGASAMDAWHRGKAGNSTHPVGQNGANAWGLGDMLGNVWEWCDDWYAPYDTGAARDPLQRNANLSDKPRRVLRGGSWLREPKFCRPAARYRNDPLSRNADNGFRVMTFDIEARTVPPAAKTPPVNLEATEAAPPQHSAPIERHSPSPPSPPSSSRGFGFRWLLALPVIGVVFGILIAIVRALAKPLTAISGGSVGGVSRTSGSSTQPLRVRIGDDGFWIDGRGVSAGTPIMCRFTAGGVSQDLDVRYEPGSQGQFVFTGSRPTQVAVSVKPGASGSRSRQTGEAIGVESEIDRDAPFRGHPPAY